MPTFLNCEVLSLSCFKTFRFETTAFIPVAKFLFSRVVTILVNAAFEEKHVETFLCTATRYTENLQLA